MDLFAYLKMYQSYRVIIINIISCNCNVTLQSGSLSIEAGFKSLEIKEQVYDFAIIVINFLNE